MKASALTFVINKVYIEVHNMQNSILVTLINAVMNRTDREHVIIAIDGPSATGKTTFAKNIKKHFDCNVFHMDDFFLPDEKKTEERLATPGGNVDWERFKEQVLDKIRTNEPFTYDIYHCGTGDITKSKVITPKRLNIVEGVYSMHPELREAYEYELFFDVARPKQLDRIKKRSSEKMLKRFVEEWIPLEDRYFKANNTKKEADFCFDTTRAF